MMNVPLLVRTACITSHQRWKYLGALLLITALGFISSCSFPGFARTPPLPPGVAASGGIAQLEALTLNGSTQYVQIRAHDPSAPLLLYLAGGPGGSEMAWFRHFHPELERHFIVVHWDQRGSGKSYAAADWDSLSPDDYVDDAGELISLLLDRFDRERLVLVGNSWGSILGVRLAMRWPEKLHAYIGVTQQVNVIETDQLGYERTLERARQAGNEDDVATLEQLGPPPYLDERFGRRSTKLIRLQDRYGGTTASRRAGDAQMSVALRAPEYSWWDRINFFRGLWKGWTRVYPQLAELDSETEVQRLSVPVWLFLSKDDITVPPEPAERWLENLDAPVKKIVWFANAGHTLVIDAREQFDTVLINRVLPSITNGKPTS